MHEFNYSIPHFVIRIQGTCIVVTPDIVSDVLHVPRVTHPNYLGCDRLRTMSKDELSSLLYERPSSWSDRQNTPCLDSAKGSRFLNKVMTFLHPLSQYNSITKPSARFLLSLLERLTIDFSSHFIVFLIDVYRDTVTHDISFSYCEAFSPFFCLLSRVFLFYSYVCHRRCYRQRKRGPASTEVVTDRDSDSSDFFHSFHIRTFFIDGWCDPRSGHGAAATHGCSP